MKPSKSSRVALTICRLKRVIDTVAVGETVVVALLVTVLVPEVIDFLITRVVVPDEVDVSVSAVLVIIVVIVVGGYPDTLVEVERVVVTSTSLLSVSVSFTVVVIVFWEVLREVHGQHDTGVYRSM